MSAASIVFLGGIASLRQRSSATHRGGAHRDDWTGRFDAGVAGGVSRRNGGRVLLNSEPIYVSLKRRMLAQRALAEVHIAERLRRNATGADEAATIP
jgi:hypothetical protein